MNVKEKIKNKLDKFVSVKFILSFLAIICATILTGIDKLTSTQWIRLIETLVLGYGVLNTIIKFSKANVASEKTKKEK